MPKRDRELLETTSSKNTSENKKRAKLHRDEKDNLYFENPNESNELDKEIEEIFHKKESVKKNTEREQRWRKLALSDRVVLKKQLAEISGTNFFIVPQEITVAKSFMRCDVKFMLFDAGSIADHDSDDLPLGIKIDGDLLMLRKIENHLLIYCNMCSNPKALLHLFNKFLLDIGLKKCSTPAILTKQNSIYEMVEKVLGDHSKRQQKLAKIVLKEKCNKKLYVFPPELIKNNNCYKTGSGDKQARLVYISEDNMSVLKEFPKKYFGDKKNALYMEGKIKNLLIIYCPTYSNKDDLLKLFNDYLDSLGLARVNQVYSLSKEDAKYKQLEKCLAGQIKENTKYKKILPRNQSTKKSEIQIMDLFEQRSFYRIGNQGKFLFMPCDSLVEANTFKDKFRRHVFFRGKVTFQVKNLNNSHFLVISYDEQSQEVFRQKNIEIPNITKTYHSREHYNFTSLFDFSDKMKDFLRDRDGVKKSFFMEQLLVTVAEKALWRKLFSNSQDCRIYFNEEIRSNMPLFSQFFYHTLMKISKNFSDGFQITERSLRSVTVKNYPALIQLLIKNNCLEPVVHQGSYQQALSTVKKMQPRMPILQDHTPPEASEEISPFSFLSMAKYQEYSVKIKQLLPDDLRESFSLTPKTVFYLNSKNDIQKFNATLQVIRHERMCYVQSGDWEKNFCIKIVEPLSSHHIEFGVFAAKDISFKPATKLGHYGRFIEDSQPDDLTFAYELEDGYIDCRDENNQVCLNAVSLMNTAVSEFDAFIRVIGNPDNPHQLDVITTDMTSKETIQLKKDQQVFNFYSPTYLPVLENKNMSFIPLNKNHGNKTLAEEFPEDTLRREFVEENTLDAKSKSKLNALVSRHSFFASGRHQDKKILLPVISKTILDENYHEWQNSSLENQAEYPLLLIKNGKLCPRDEQPDITPLMLACYFGNYPAIQFLLALNVMINRADARLNTAIFYALNHPNDNLNVIEALINTRELDITVQNGIKDTPFHQAISCQKSQDVVKLLLDANYFNLDYLEIKNDQSLTVMDMALKSECDEVIKLFKTSSSDRSDPEEEEKTMRL